ncbi:MAG: dihydroxyacetone kinase subunit L [Anaerolineae bacterium]|nr:dihydroxyacetone kinase subunit L [Anaerolineae bacterium]
MTDHAAIVAKCIDAALAIIVEKERELGDLDAVAGDGDHGAGMVRGFRAAAAVERSGTASQVLVNAGMAFSNAAGGASGALVGTWIMRVGMSLQGEILDASTVHAALDKAAIAVAQLGNTRVGDKTMLDTLSPFAEAYGNAAATGASISAAWAQALPTARLGMEITRNMIATRGRASVLGERSRGTQDPGATSMYYVLAAVGDVLAADCPSESAAPSGG